ncbi:hypothetical protein [Geomesophilobacter sediminis]|uniref:Uncharacterized protein n=1 Tax=Geomesophilobacter sediminis TaxID=2798584 RepID=A0A8J7M230_9BACT|nr:hypothetical protein [Geomesophilobacter sediminis]MBJ6727074.1 hypothetical protein [Geomesophilobacter sediminis]
MSVEWDDLEELTKEIRRQIESNRQFLKRVSDEDFDDEPEAGGDEEVAEETDEDPEDFEEL